MSPDTTLQALVERYLDERHRLGFSARTQAYALRSFARHVQAVGHHGPITLDVMAGWARCDSHASSDPHTWARRLKLLRSFTHWLVQFEPATEVPGDAIFGRVAGSLIPHKSGVVKRRRRVGAGGAVNGTRAARVGPRCAGGRGSIRTTDRRTAARPA